jgi:two-component system response regulator FixJ
MKKRILVDLIDDDEAVLDALSLYLEAKGFVVRAHRSARDFLQARGDAPAADCIVADVRMPRLSGLELQTVLNRRKAKEPLILITGFADIDVAVSAMKAGAFDFIEKPVSEERLVASIKAAVTQAGRQQAEHQQLSAIEALVAKLSNREREVLHLAARGLTSRQIAGELGISPRTVEVYRATVMQKTGAGSIADLVRIAMRLAPLTTVASTRRR